MGDLQYAETFLVVLRFLELIDHRAPLSRRITWRTAGAAISEAPRPGSELSSKKGSGPNLLLHKRDQRAGSDDHDGEREAREQTSGRIR